MYSSFFLKVERLEEATQECIVGGSILRCYRKQKLVRPMCSLSTIRDGHHEMNRVKFRL